MTESANDKRARGWFAVPGVQDGDRTLEEQMLGLGPAFSVMTGKTVADLGCAEGLIAIEALLGWGAATVHGFENSMPLVRSAREYAEGLASIAFIRHDLNNGWPPDALESYDVTLALAIIHKLVLPSDCLRQFAQRTRERIVLRLPIGSKGAFRAKHGLPPEHCDTRVVLQSCGFALEQELPGPRGELVHHWIRVR